MRTLAEGAARRRPRRNLCANQVGHAARHAATRACLALDSRRRWRTRFAGPPTAPFLSVCDFRRVVFVLPAESRLAKGRMAGRRREEGTVARQEYGHLVLAMVALAGCALLLVSFQFAHGRAALLSGLLPIMQHAFSGPVPPRPGPSNAHRLFGALDRPLEQSITPDSSHGLAVPAGIEHVDKLNRKLLRLQRERNALTARRQQIIGELVTERDRHRRRVASNAVVSHHQRLRGALMRATRRERALFAQAGLDYLAAKTHSSIRTANFLRRRDRFLSNAKQLDLMVHGDGQ